MANPDNMTSSALDVIVGHTFVIKVWTFALFIWKYILLSVFTNTISSLVSVCPEMVW